MADHKLLQGVDLAAGDHAEGVELSALVAHGLLEHVDPLGHARVLGPGADKQGLHQHGLTLCALKVPDELLRGFGNVRRLVEQAL